MQVKKEILGCSKILPRECTLCGEVLAVEAPIIFSVNGKYLSRFTCTPEDLEDLALGILDHRDMIASPSELVSCEVTCNEQAEMLHLDVTLSHEVPAEKFEEPLTSQDVMSADVSGLLVPFYGTMSQTRPIRASVVRKAIADLIEFQVWFRETGATHGCAFVDFEGNLLVAREDISRSNALDKVLGALLKAGLDPNDGFILLSSRLAGALALRVAAAGIATIVCMSAPSTLGVRVCRDHKMGLAGFARGERFTIYSEPERFLVD